MPINSLASFTPPTIPNQDEAEAAAQSANESSSSSECSAAPSSATIAPVDKVDTYSVGQQGGLQEHGGGADGGSSLASLRYRAGIDSTMVSAKLADATQTFEQKQAKAPAQPQAKPQTFGDLPNQVSNTLITAVRDADAVKDCIGNAIDSGEKSVENTIDEGRAWLSSHAGPFGCTLATDIGVAEGAAIAVYDTGKGLVQMADGAASLLSPAEWAANPQANIARVKNVLNVAETLSKVANLTNPLAWAANPQGNLQTATALAQAASAAGHGAVQSLEQDPAKFTGEVAGTIATAIIPGGGEAAAATDIARGVEIAGDAGKAVEVAADASKAEQLANDAGTVAKAGQQAEEAASKAADAAKAETAGGTVAKGTDKAEAGGGAAETFANRGKVVKSFSANEIRLSQKTVSYNKIDRITGTTYTYDDLVKNMKTNGWKGNPVDVVRMPDGKLTSMDNTRIMAAREAGIDVQAVVHDYNEPLTRQMQADRGWQQYNTWGEAIQGRIQRQGSSFSKANPYGVQQSPHITGKPQ